MTHIKRQKFINSGAVDIIRHAYHMRLVHLTTKSISIEYCQK